MLQELLALALLHVDANDTGNEARQGMSDSARALLECSFKEMGADELSLVFGCGLPVLRHKPQGRDGGELANALVAMCQGDVDEEEKGLGLGVVVLLEVGSDGLDLLRIGCTAREVSKTLLSLEDEASLAKRGRGRAK
jgi:hypothetical protein